MWRAISLDPRYFGADPLPILENFRPACILANQLECRHDSYSPRAFLRRILICINYLSQPVTWLSDCLVFSIPRRTQESRALVGSSGEERIGGPQCGSEFQLNELPAYSFTRCKAREKNPWLLSQSRLRRTLPQRLRGTRPSSQAVPATASSIVDRRLAC